ncbi:MAG: hypothetical protein LIO79_04075 [Rikenellaceae bacterium]|nr:hypothetical protein [Rikenellaceae bacterium]
MKKFINLFLLTCILSCDKLPLQYAETIYRPELLHDMDYGVAMQIVPVHYDSIPEYLHLEITNETNGTIQFGADYRIERYDTDEDKWVDFGSPAETAFIAIMYILDPGKSQSYDIRLFPDKIGYSPGSYRITKVIFADEESRIYWASFILN